MFNLGIGEVAVILAAGLLIFGAKRIPEAARALGQSINAFKTGLKDGSSDAEVKKLPDESKV